MIPNSTERYAVLIFMPVNSPRALGVGQMLQLRDQATENEERGLPCMYISYQRWSLVRYTLLCVVYDDLVCVRHSDASSLWSL